jgi:catalase-peroxidase
VGKDAITSGLEVVWTATPTTWDNTFLEMLYGYEWELTKSPGGAWQFTTKDGAGAGTIPDPFGGPARTPTMLVTDITMRVDPIYGEITRRWLDHPEELSEAFGKAWYKLLHRDMGPLSRYLGPWVAEPQLWQDPVPAVDHALVTDEDVKALKAKIFDSGVSVSQLVSAAWASAASFRGTDLRGGANGARIRLAPQKAWEVNKTADLDAVLPALEKIQSDFNGSASGGKKISLADLIVLGGSAAIEKAAKDAGHDIAVPFAPGRTDASQEQTDVETFAVLEPRADGFRNYLRVGEKAPAEHLLVDRAYMLNLTAPEMTVLIGGLRVLGNGKTKHGVFTDRPGTLTNDFFVNLLDMGTAWKVSASTENVYEGSDRATGTPKWTATGADLVFGSNSILRSLAEAYATDDAKDKFVADFVKAWVKVMNNDRFDL